MLKTFHTDRLVLKELTLADDPAYTKGYVDYDVIRHMDRRVPWPYPDGGVKDFLETQVMPFQGETQWYWGIFLKESLEELIGCINLRISETDNRGLWLRNPIGERGI